MEMGGKGLDWMHLTHDRDYWRPLVNTIMNFRGPYKMGTFFICVTITFLRRILLYWV